MTGEESSGDESISAGMVRELPSDRCLAIAGGRALIVQTDDGPRAYLNRCSHAGEPIAAGWVADGVLACPSHFWRLELATGQVVGIGAGDEGLEPLATEIVDG